jgi:teichoic acid transport system permease protein
VSHSDKTKVRVYDAELRIPPIKPYLEDTFAHLRFAFEKAKLDLVAANKNTWFGQLWNIINPFLLAVLYWFLVVVLFGAGGSIFDREGMRILTQIVGGLFLWGLPSAAFNLGARSIIQGGSFILNTRIPRMILPISSVLSGFMNFAPSILVYLLFHALARYSFSIHMLWAFPIIAIIFLISLGFAMMAATGTVYYRDLASFLPFVSRMWLYLTPIIYLYTLMPESLSWTFYANPYGGLFAAMQQILFESSSPNFGFILAGLGWSIVSISAGIMMFLRKEREFAVRI